MLNRTSSRFLRGAGQPDLKFLPFLLILIWLPFAAFAQSNDDCLSCHSDKTLKADNGSSLYVDLKSFNTSPHGKAGVSCVDCHQDLENQKEYPHPSPLKSASCLPCHEDIANVYLTSPHGKLLTAGDRRAPDCNSCHRDVHAMSSRHDACSSCDRCHKPVSSMLSQSGHGGAACACSECHGSHSLRQLKPGPKGGCQECHPHQFEAYAAGPHGVARGQGNLNAPDCIACHGGTHSVTRLANAREACQNCHQGRAEAVAGSVHGQAFSDGHGYSAVCYKCHTGHQVYLQKGRNRATCGGCHEKIEDEYEVSLHGYALSKGIRDAPDCTSCHGDHRILTAQDPESPIHRKNIHLTCGRCHGEESVMAEGLIRLPRAALTYEGSVHGQAIRRGLETAATCPDCHGDHSLRGAGDPRSEININNIAGTCGKCHNSIRMEYQESIHGRALKVGITDSPACTGCHGEHQILSPENPQSPTSAARQAQETCARCHNNPVIIRKYGLEGSVVQTYEDSYHGLAVRGRSERAATCSACHTSHNVQPAADSTSTVNPANVVETCRKCHPGANQRFAQSYTHARLGRLESPVNVVVRNLYLFLLLFIIGGMVIHNLIILNWHMLRAKRRQESGQTITRFDRMQIVQHLVLTVTFIGLAVTGFALKFPDAAWVRALSALGLHEGLRSVIHRVMAVLLIAFGVFHIGYILFSRRGREELIALIPTKKDAKDVWLSLMFHIGLSQDKPQFGQFEYSQKGEYWALVWGTFIMALTGFILWFPVRFMNILPVWAIEVAQTVHYYEAWLATLAIVVWHFFFVIFHPEMYPMSWTWLTGKMNVRDVREHHSLWYEELKREGVIKPDGEEKILEDDAESGEEEKSDSKPSESEDS